MGVVRIIVGEETAWGRVSVIGAASGGGDRAVSLLQTHVFTPFFCFHGQPTEFRFCSSSEMSHRPAE